MAEMKGYLTRLSGALLLAGCANCALAAADDEIAAGEGIYVQCSGCHAPAYHRTGPMHCGLLGRTAGSVPGYAFTEAMKRSQLVWDAATLDRFLSAPLSLVPGTSMGFAGIASAAERRQLLAFLATLNSDNPLCG